MEEEVGEKQLNNQVIYHNLLNPSNKVHCDNCEKNITKHTKIICAVCSIDICVPCFADGVEIKSQKTDHKPDHDYHVVNKLHFPLFQNDWTAEQELMLLDGLERFGFGNWQEIADHIGTEKSKEEVEDHYEQVYLKQGQPDYLPSQNLLTKRDPKSLELTITQRNRSNSEEVQRQQRISKKKSQKLADNKNSQQKKANQNVNTGSQAQEIIGYWPKRGDFDIEYDNDAELLLAEMEFNEDDKQGEIDMKLKILQIYNARLDERLKRKKFVIERGLLDIKKQNSLDKERTKEEKEIYNMMKPFARFSTKEEHEKLVMGIIKEKQIRQRIEELRTYRKLGLKNFEQVEKYLQDKKKKDEAYQKKQKQNNEYVYDKAVLGNRHNQSRRTRSVYPENDTNKDGGDKKNKQPLNMTEQEQQLCEKLEMHPFEYLAIKEVLVREAVKENFIKRDNGEQQLKLDKERLAGVFDYLVTHNYIMEKPN
ncbi:Homeodomain protein [Pseudocohnilembus persalinus]|uniref:Transcriptional adapter n=1 Tax=Pseudocohnilembus persalinus TaxID=266149 RepID=A0A0V0QX95_PSEPJ|nr:Homeodomain protein [Pseudocohnilembus persalinus]|eukprot:KRX06785.1 Homeodomain protein [Pseudocohnilembus persalinus]